MKPYPRASKVYFPIKSHDSPCRNQQRNHKSIGCNSNSVQRLLEPRIAIVDVVVESDLSRSVGPGSEIVQMHGDVLFQSKFPVLARRDRTVDMLAVPAQYEFGELARVFDADTSVAESAHPFLEQCLGRSVMHVDVVR